MIKSFLNRKSCHITVVSPTDIIILYLLTKKLEVHTKVTCH